MQIKQKTFIHALKIVHGDTKKANKFLSDNRMTLAEKKILAGWVMLKSCQHQELIEAMESISSFESDLIEAQKDLLLGVAHNNIGHFALAIHHIMKSLGPIKRYALPDHHFIALYNIFIAKCNKNDIPGMAETLKEMDKIPKSESYELCQILCEFNLYATKGQFDKAYSLVKPIEERLADMSDSMIMTYLISKFLLHVKVDNLHACEETLVQMKKYRLFRSSSTFTFMRTLVNHLLHDKPIYVYREDFKDSEAMFQQLKVIEALEETDVAKASMFWSKLQKLEPDNYHADFKYTGEKNLFAVCLDKYRPKIETKLEIKSLPENKVDAFLHLLQVATIPLRKEVIFESLWGGQMMSQADDNKIKNLIYYIRKNKNVNVVYRKGCYMIVESDEGSEVA